MNEIIKQQRASALIAGFSILLMAVIAVFSFEYAHNTIVIPNDISITLNNLRGMSTLFHAEIFGWIIILLLDITVSIALYNYFKIENRKIAWLMSAFRLVYSAILGLAIFNLMRTSSIANQSIKNIPEIIQQKVLLLLNAFESTWSIGLIIFGFHLLLLGYLAYKSHNIHWLWGVILFFAAISYIVVHTAKSFLPGAQIVNTIEMVLSVPMAVGEIGFAIWLIIRGKRVSF